MTLIQRAINICITPKTEWPIIEAEKSSISDLFVTYIIPLSLIPVIALFIGTTMIGVTVPFIGSYRTPFTAAIISAVLQFGLGLVSIYILSLIIDALAPSFGGQKNPIQALKVIAYAFTPAWIIGVINVIPSLAVLVLLASLYSIYVLYLGLPILMKVPQDKAAGYTIVSVICAIVMSIILGITVAAISGAALMGAGKLGLSSSNQTITGADSAVNELEKWGKQMEEAGKKIEQAEKSGDTAGQMAAANEALGTMLGGDGNVDVVDMAKLKVLLPETLGGLKRTSIEAEKTAMGTFKVAKAHAIYADDNNKRLEVSITDFAGNKLAGMMLGLGGMEIDKETDHGYEKIHKVDGRSVIEKYNKDNATSEYHVLVADRFMLEVNGEGVDMATVKTAANSIGFSQLEAMKNDGKK